MPRISAENRGAIAYRSGSKPPPAPARLDPEAAAIWRVVVRSKPLGWFDASSLALLELYCTTLVKARQVAVELAPLEVRTPGVERLERRLIRLNSNTIALATKLRLTVQAAVNRRSRMLDEAGVGDHFDGLLGGSAFARLGRR